MSWTFQFVCISYKKVCSLCVRLIIREITLNEFEIENREIQITIRMEFAVRIVGSYRERDKLIRLLQYICRFLSGAAQTNSGKKLALIASELGSCRTVLRLFDDIPMLSHTLRYGFGSKVLSFVSLKNRFFFMLQISVLGYFYFTRVIKS